MNFMYSNKHNNILKPKLTIFKFTMKEVFESSYNLFATKRCCNEQYIFK